MGDARANRYARIATWGPPALIAIVAIHISLAMIGGDWPDTHERIWYPVRLVEYVQGWRGGSFYPRWCPDLYGGYGYPFFNYYAPGFFTTAAIFMVSLGVSATTALELTIGLFTVLGGLGVYGLVRGETRRSDAALLSALVFLYAPYRFTDMFTRGDYAEHAALSLLPFAVWGYRALGRADDGKVPLIGVLAAVAHAAVWICHTITGLYTTEVIGLMLLIGAFVHRRRKPELQRVLIGCCVLLLALAMASIYLLPAWFERSLVNLQRVRDGIFHPTKNLVEGAWPFAYGFFSFGLPLLVGLGATAVSLALPRRRNTAALARWWVPAIVIASLIFTWAEPIWRVLPLGSYIQFPWRLIGFVALFGAVGFGVTAANLLPARAPLAWRVCALLAIGVIGVERPYDRVNEFVAAEKIPTTPEAIQHGFYSTVVVNEYLPVTVGKPPTTPRVQSAVPVIGDPVLSTWHLTPLSYQLEIDAAQPSGIDMQVFDFPGWKVKTVEGPAEVERGTTDQGLIRLWLPVHGHYRVKIYFGLTLLRAFAALLSLLSLAFGFSALKRIQRLVSPRPSAPRAARGSP